MTLPIDGIIWGMRRIKVPERFIQLTTNMMKQRSLSVQTIHGKSRSFVPTRGLPQGNIISPILWAVFYDSLLCRLDAETHGYELNENLSFTHTAFADDLHPMSDTEEDFQAQLDIINSFLKMFGMNMRPAKCSIVSTDNHLTQQFMVSGNHIKQMDNSELIRLLGVFWTFDGKNEKTYDNAMDTLNKCIAKMKRKYVPGKVSSYIINAVLIPKIVHRLQLVPLTRKVIDDIEKSIRMICKLKHYLSKNTKSTTLHDKRYHVQINEFERVMTEKSVSDFANWGLKEDKII